MNWKDAAIDKLKAYEPRRKALETIPLELERLQSAFARIRSAAADVTPVSGGSPREDAILSNIVQRDELKQRLKEARLWIAAVDKALEALDDDDRRTLDRCFIHRVKGSIGLLCEELCIETATVYRRRDSALRRFTLAFYGITESI